MSRREPLPKSWIKRHKTWHCRKKRRDLLSYQQTMLVVFITIIGRFSTANTQKTDTEHSTLHKMNFSCWTVINFTDANLHKHFARFVLAAHICILLLSIHRRIDSNIHENAAFSWWKKWCTHTCLCIIPSPRHRSIFLFFDTFFLRYLLSRLHFCIVSVCVCV